jgi:hypothetical protein
MALGACCGGGRGLFYGTWPFLFARWGAIGACAVSLVAGAAPASAQATQCSLAGWLEIGRQLGGPEAEPGAEAFDEAVRLKTGLSELDRRLDRERQSTQSERQRLEEQLARYDTARQQRSGSDLTKALLRGGNLGQQIGRELRRSIDPPAVQRQRERLGELESAGTLGRDQLAAARAQADRANALAANASGAMLQALASAPGGPDRFARLLTADRLFRERAIGCFEWQGTVLTDVTMAQAEVGMQRVAGELAAAATEAGRSAGPVLTAEIAALRTGSDVNRFRASYLSSQTGRDALGEAGVLPAFDRRSTEIVAEETAAAASAEQENRARLAEAREREAAALAREQASREEAAARVAVADRTRSQQTGEPTEAEMRDAIQAQFDFRTERLGFGQEAIRLTYFEKLGCEKAQDRIGYNCDYGSQIAFLRDLPPIFGGGADLIQFNSGRFFRRGDAWDVIQQNKD